MEKDVDVEKVRRTFVGQFVGFSFQTLSRLRLSPGVELLSGLLLLAWMVKP